MLGRDEDSAEMKEYRNGLNDPAPTGLTQHESDYIYRKSILTANSNVHYHTKIKKDCSNSNKLMTMDGPSSMPKYSLKLIKSLGLPKKNSL